MDIIMVPGFWLNASSWSHVTPAIEAAGHNPRPVTLPGLESRDADRSAITVQDHIDAIVAAIDAAGDDVAIVAHSGGGPLAYAALDVRPTRVRRIIYVDTVPLNSGGAVNPELPIVNDEIPLPDWDDFEEEDLVDLDDSLRERFRATAIAEPVSPAYDPIPLSDDDRRRDVPATVIACEFGSSQIDEWIGKGVPFTAELASLRNRTVVDLPTGHWPQFTKPAELGRAIVDALQD
jgi:pimeloyl-ACP methyl ester carboxylesterase